MKLLVQGSALGELPHYVAAEGAAHAPSLRELLGMIGNGGRAIDLVGLRQFFDRRPDGERTCFEGAKPLPAGFDLYCEDSTLHRRRRKLPEPYGALLPLLEKAVSELLTPPRKIAIALSGGLDSALVLALARRTTDKSFPVVTLATRLPGYCELEQTLQTARLLGAEVDVIEVAREEFVSALPDAIAACETPLFNLHPVSKFLLARALAQRGYEAVLTGDGADQTFAGSDARNYLPVVGAMVRATRLEFLSPFFDERIVGWARCHGADSEKTALREAASAILPTELVWRKKEPRLAPDFDLHRFRDPQLEARLAPKLGFTPAAQPGPQQTLWATTAILVRHLKGTC